MVQITVSKPIQSRSWKQNASTSELQPQCTPTPGEHLGTAPNIRPSPEHDELSTAPRRPVWPGQKPGAAENFPQGTSQEAGVVSKGRERQGWELEFWEKGEEERQWGRREEMGSGIYIQTNTCKDVRQLCKICTCTLAYNENILLNELNGKVKTEEV